MLQNWRERRPLGTQVRLVCQYHITQISIASLLVNSFDFFKTRRLILVRLLDGRSLEVPVGILDEFFHFELHFLAKIRRLHLILQRMPCNLAAKQVELLSSMDGSLVHFLRNVGFLLDILAPDLRILNEPRRYAHLWRKLVCFKFLAISSMLIGIFDNPAKFLTLLW